MPTKTQLPPYSSNTGTNSNRPYLDMALHTLNRLQPWLSIVETILPSNPYIARFNAENLKEIWGSGFGMALLAVCYWYGIDGSE